MILDGEKTVRVRLGIGEESPQFHVASRGYAEEAVTVCEYDLEKGVDAVPAPSAP
jgi:hypothetical protein